MAGSLWEGRPRAGKEKSLSNPNTICWFTYQIILGNCEVIVCGTCHDQFDVSRVFMAGALWEGRPRGSANYNFFVCALLRARPRVDGKN
jgi:hypothetical protein